MTKSPWPKGLVTAILTPLRDDEVDVPALEKLVEHQIAAGATGLVVTGGTGEYGALSIEERQQMFREVVRIARGRVVVVAQTGCLATRDAIRLSQIAEQAGATGLLVASPFGEPISWRERVNFYKQLDAAVSVPIMLYNTPPSGLMTFAQIAELAELKNVSGVKDSSGDPIMMGDLLAWAKPLDFAVYVGMDCFLYEAILGGATGAVFGAANIIPERLVAVIAGLQRNGSSPALLEDWRKVRPFLRFVEGARNYVGLCKAGCKLRGLDLGVVRAPYMMPEAGEVSAMNTWLEKLGVRAVD